MLKWFRNNVVLQRFINLKYFNILRYILINSLFITCIFFGFIYEEPIEGAYNLAMFMAWYIIICTPILYTKVMQEKLIKEGNSVPIWFDNIIDLGIIITFVWYGNVWTAAFLLLACIFKISAWEQVKQTIEKRKSSQI